ncbi:MAG TPA: PDR/VanB family oxidoreductase [Flexivirga sp.]|uniref:PDR/VanB family oxidoreductase n=1 Tax=Flexivirga sp. TaxID=1962927 RepID=UPI002C1D4C9D|nr:PDR/VanB family oxidoreductase [Flexivirga sp.]HWC22487.1 PDR/VanB family oxidoreductase [Flexivirga sp.]
MATDNAVRWTSAEVVEVETVARDVRRIVLSPEEAVHARPGSHVDVRPGHSLDDRNDDLHDNDPRPGTLTRSYSVVDSTDGGRRLTLTVQLATASRGGSARMHRLAVGDRIAVTQPLQNFPLGVGAPRYILLAGGIGITAVLAMAQALRSRGADYHLVVSGRSRADLPYLERLTALHGDRLELHISDEGTRLDVMELVGQVRDGDHPLRTELYMCGPIGLLDAVRQAWATHGLPAPNLRFETFGSSGSWQAQPFTIRLADTGREVRVPANSTALEALEAAGMAVMSDCRKGECGLCAVRVLEVSGRVDHRDVFLDDTQKAAADQLCLCVSRAAVPTRGPDIGGTDDIDDPDGTGNAVLTVRLA